MENKNTEMGSQEADEEIINSSISLKAIHGVNQNKYK
jgi:hypothetical protein